ncbi:MAG: sigma-70 family RNA polymerase sigma factor [Flavobacteriales bacterium]|nr:sigma-70 family RNA polymerase sigma factor [Flavobacteriales bacterium]
MSATTHLHSDAEVVAFLKRYQRAIRYGIRLAGTPDQERDDVYQEVCLHLLETFRRRQAALEHNLTFAVTVGRQRAISWARAHRRHWHGSAIPELAADAADPLERLVRLQGHERLRACVELLPILQREVLRRVLSGRPQACIAFDLNLTLAGVRTLAQRGRAGLRRMLINPLYH